MHVSASAGSPAIHGHNHAKPANFGSLNSAIARGDLSKAQAAFATLSTATNPAAKAITARANIDELSQALTANDIDAARAALAKFRSRDVTATEPAPVATTPAPVSEPEASQVVNLLA